MKTRNLFPCLGVALRSRVLPALIAALNLLSVGQAPAQTFTTLHSLSTWSPDSDGYSDDGPEAGLILTNNTLYGTVRSGGTAGFGTVFGLRTDGTGFTVLHNFVGTPGDGAGPAAGLMLSGNTLYGTTAGANLNLPYWGGSTVFAVNTDGTDYTNLFTFQGTPDYGAFVNLTGAQPLAGLILSGNTLYGTAYWGGSVGDGTVFALSTNGTGFTVLHNSSSTGANPQAGLILSGNTLYGTTSGGYYSGSGAVFAVSTNGTGFTNLHSFTSGSDGATPQAGLILSGNTLYGTTSGGGSSGSGTVFAVKTNGTGFTILHTFSGSSSDGAYPLAGLILSGATLYGTASRGGSSGGGTVFSLSFRPQLTIAPSGRNVILSWPTNIAGFDYTGYRVQSTTNPGSSAVWSTNSPAPVVLAGRNTVTMPVASAQQFYRLVQ